MLVGYHAAPLLPGEDVRYGVGGSGRTAAASLMATAPGFGGGEVAGYERLAHGHGVRYPHPAIPAVALRLDNALQLLKREHRLQLLKTEHRLQLLKTEHRLQLLKQNTDYSLCKQNTGFSF